MSSAKYLGILFQSIFERLYFLFYFNQGGYDSGMKMLQTEQIGLGYFYWAHHIISRPLYALFENVGGIKHVCLTYRKVNGWKVKLKKYAPFLDTGDIRRDQ